MGKVITITAPSAAPVDRPSVSGEASGLRRKAWNTTPATARLLPTRIHPRPPPHPPPTHTPPPPPPPAAPSSPDSSPHPEPTAPPATASPTTATKNAHA